MASIFSKILSTTAFLSWTNRPREVFCSVLLLGQINKGSHSNLVVQGSGRTSSQAPSKPSRSLKRQRWTPPLGSRQPWTWRTVGGLCARACSPRAGRHRETRQRQPQSPPRSSGTLASSCFWHLRQAASPLPPAQWEWRRPWSWGDRWWPPSTAAQSTPTAHQEQAPQHGGAWSCADLRVRHQRWLNGKHKHTKHTNTNTNTNKQKETDDE